MIILILFLKLSRSPFWEVMHDGIQKFNNDYQGVYIHSLDKEILDFDY